MDTGVPQGGVDGKGGGVKFTPLRTEHEERVLAAARKYARMKVFGTSIERNMTVRFCRSDQEMQAKYLAQVLESAAVDLLDAMAVDEVNGELQP